MKKKILISILVIIIIILLLWITGVIPKAIGVNTAKKYVEENYAEMNLEYDTIEFSSAHGDYFVKFVDKEDKIYNFMVSPKILPIEIMYDGVNGGV